MRQRQKRAAPLYVREFRGEIRYNLFEQEVSEGNSPQPLQTVADGIKHRRVRLFGREDRRADIQQGGQITREPLRQCDFHKDNWLVGQRRMEEGEASPVRL